jgi:hypothetical protein
MDCRRSRIRSEKYPLSVDAEDVCAKLFGASTLSQSTQRWWPLSTGLQLASDVATLLGSHTFSSARYVDGRLRVVAFGLRSWPVLTSIQFKGTRKEK